MTLVPSQKYISLSLPSFFTQTALFSEKSILLSNAVSFVICVLDVPFQK
jgi:hypothetical protein